MSEYATLWRIVEVKGEVLAMHLPNENQRLKAPILSESMHGMQVA
jgi:hypothetical protein